MELARKVKTIIDLSDDYFPCDFLLDSNKFIAARKNLI